MTVTERNDLVISHMSYAERLASIQFRKTHGSVQFEELKSAAYMGLVDAANKYDRQGDFVSYARWRIIGEMQDYLRGRPLSGRSKSCRIRFFAEEEDYAEESEPESFQDFFEDLTVELKDITKKVLYMYYAEDCTLKQISQRMAVSTTRVHQILQAGLRELRAKMEVDNS